MAYASQIGLVSGSVTTVQPISCWKSTSLNEIVSIKVSAVCRPEEPNRLTVLEKETQNTAETDPQYWRTRSAFVH
jgi:hypothetical protein